MLYHGTWVYYRAKSLHLHSILKSGRQFTLEILVISMASWFIKQTRKNGLILNYIVFLSPYLKPQTNQTVLWKKKFTSEISGVMPVSNEPHREKTGFLHRRKQRRRSASQ